MNIPNDAMAFNDQFNSEEQCLAFLEELRWPNGFVCPNCNHDNGYRISTRRLIQCAVCRHQTSVTAGTIFHKTRIPLRVWFYILFSVGHDKGGASSTRLANELQMHQTTVWHLLHKIRTAMGRRDESILLSGFIEMDEAVLGPHARRPRISRADSQKKSPKLTSEVGGAATQRKEKLRQTFLYL